jgi:hypothetical protein
LAALTLLAALLALLAGLSTLTGLSAFALARLALISHLVVSHGISFFVKQARPSPQRLRRH